MKKNYIVVDVESDGPIIGLNSMVCFGAVILEPGLNRTFYGQTKPISHIFNPEALAISGFTREEHEAFPAALNAMKAFDEWLKENVRGRPTLLSDNNGYDASWLNWYFHSCLGHNPFGWTSRRIGDLFCGFYKDMHYGWKKHRISKHTHHPVDDAKGNAEALLYLHNQGLKLF